MPELTHFASSERFTREQLVQAPVRWPRPQRLDEPLQIERQKGPKAQAALDALGLHTVGDLIGHLPRGGGESRTIATLQAGETGTVVVEVRSITSRPVRRRGMRPLVEATVADSTGVMQVTFFNQPWLTTRYPPGTRLIIGGKYEARNRFRVSAHAETTSNTGGAEGVATYRATEGISSLMLHALVSEHRAAMTDVPEPLPLRMRREHDLPDTTAALAAAHGFSSGGPTDQEHGRRRLAFDELLIDQIVQLRLRADRRTLAHAEPLTDPPSRSEHWRSAELPFTPTNDQLRAMDEIDLDLAREIPMQRLLMGEVGSGKTVVALHAMLRAVDHGGQAVLMAPTETLAEQHFATLQALMPGGMVPAALLTGSTTQARRRDLLGKLATGELALLVGTHAVIEDPVVFADLLVAVVDEQHRFGVRQRAALDAKAATHDPGRAPHVLHMTATPIPRTMRLANFGALDFTTLTELPKGRQPIATHVVAGERERARAYERIREELAAGRQAFVVCSLVEDSEAISAKAATAEYERLRTTEFAAFDVVLLHGQMRPKEKAEAMAHFASGGADVLVATTVIEVGIDVPNATVIVIEDAERYGISQLHQLRGRVGRGEHPSLCLLFGAKESPRLKALATHTDGFALAEIDLQLRGEGELTGTKQSGMARFRVARLPEDNDLLELAYAESERLHTLDPRLVEPEHALLAHALAAVEAEPVPA